MKFITFGCGSFDPDLFVSQDDPIQEEVRYNMAHVKKPSGGLWASPFNEDAKKLSDVPYGDIDDDEFDDWFFSDWESWSISIGASYQLSGLKDGFIFEMKSDARIYTISDRSKLEKLFEKYKETNLPKGYIEPTLDWLKISQDYDAVFLTKDGIMDRCCAWWNHETNNKYEINLYGWDCESIVILNKDAIDISSTESFQNPHIESILSYDD